MKADRCDRETDVLEVVRTGRWPEACDADLRAHVAGCAVCAEVVLVAEALRRQDAGAWLEARLPAAGLVWWKAQIRARREAAERAAEPMNVVAIAACACLACSLVALAVWQWPRIASWSRWFRVLPFRYSLWPTSLASVLGIPSFAILMTMALGLALVSFLLYLVFAKE